MRTCCGNGSTARWGSSRRARAVADRRCSAAHRAPRRRGQRPGPRRRGPRIRGPSGRLPRTLADRLRTRRRRDHHRRPAPRPARRRLRGDRFDRARRGSATRRPHRDPGRRGSGATVVHRKVRVGDEESARFTPGDEPAVLAVDAGGSASPSAGTRASRSTPRTRPRWASTPTSPGLETKEDSDVPDERARRVAARPSRRRRGAGTGCRG